MLASMEQLIRELDLLPRGCTVLCAVSGGADSICLLHALYRLRPKYGFHLAAAHYNHILRGLESDRDAAFVEQFVALCCGPQRQMDGTILPAVPFYYGYGDVAGQARARGKGIEETAREMRYAFLRRAAREAGADRIATAHHAGDNVETILFHLARGSGLRGLVGIRPDGDGLIRPLLTTTREEIEAYIHRHSLPYMYDSSNDGDQYARNRLRHQVIPVLEELYPGLDRRLANTAALLREDEDYLTQQARAIAAQSSPHGEGLAIPARLLTDAPRPLATRAVRLLVEGAGGGPNCSRVHVEGVLDLCRGEDPSARLDLPNGLTARREYTKLVLTAEEPLPPLEETAVALPGLTKTGGWRIGVAQEDYQGQDQGPWDFWLDRAAVPHLHLRSRRTGDRLKLPGRPTKTVKKWCVDCAIPAHLRPALPVLVTQDQVAAVAGLGPHQTFLPQMGGPAWHIILLPPGQYIGKEEPS